MHQANWIHVRSSVVMSVVGGCRTVMVFGVGFKGSFSCGREVAVTLDLFLQPVVIGYIGRTPFLIV